ncbi:ATP-binding cassette domain-containing protein [Rhodococcus sp. HM1]|uniref:ABC transporter ATP-binding protein n=1 Tax=unclassified Rhodococcus (in: high G+C Gram-positive bacteria) TaxID=192944 RepID=UPI0018CDF27A|nr:MULTISPECIES: ATP-binding cassette domain-containing protein [unclassified Rhodococcus (in: high G+C Gram-positive bacteria)]MBH0122219.1 ATP-binding cassette domain-containing protein [Rhodococcus sp. CX]MCK8669839.1 ATP-binding cassette domain-containing protein [Rhodococcus sp. HM1]
MNVLEADGLTRAFGDRNVVDAVHLSVPAGHIHALLGPNGSGKTTTVRMLATLLRPTAGRGRVCGFDVVRDAAHVKRRIGLVGQFHAVDPRLTGRENLTMFARLHGLDGRSARVRATELLDRFDLADAAARPVSSYSGGMRRRLDLLAGMVVRPEVLFLDEPTTGLDPHSRNEIYRLVRELVGEGTAVLLTTQYLDEADRLADSITILDAGVTIATGTPAQIKEAVGTGVDLALPAAADVTEAIGVTAAFGLRHIATDAASETGTVRLSFATDADSVPLLPVLRALDEAGVPVDDIGRRRVGLDEAFLTLTGHARTEEPA